MLRGAGGQVIGSGVPADGLPQQQGQHHYGSQQQAQRGGEPPPVGAEAVPPAAEQGGGVNAIPGFYPVPARCLAWQSMIDRNIGFCNQCRCWFAHLLQLKQVTAVCNHK